MKLNQGKQQNEGNGAWGGKNMEMDYQSATSFLGRVLAVVIVREYVPNLSKEAAIADEIRQ
jgi:hypothetical protein